MPWNTNLSRTIIPLLFYKQNHAYCNTVMWNLGSSFVLFVCFYDFSTSWPDKQRNLDPTLFLDLQSQEKSLTPPLTTPPPPILHSWRSKSPNDLRFHLYLLLFKPSFTALRGWLIFQPIRCQFLLSEFGWILWHVFFKHLKWSASEYL